MSQEPETNSLTQYENTEKRGFKTTSKFTTIAVAVTTILFTLLEVGFDIEFDAAMQGAVTTVITALFAWLAPPRKTGKYGQL